MTTPATPAERPQDTDSIEARIAALGRNFDDDDEPHAALVLPREQLSGRIQHTLIGQAITERQVRAHVQEALQHGFDAAIVPPCWVWAARDEVRGSVARIGSIVDYPNGSGITSVRVAEVKALVDAGVDELDATINVGFLLSSRLPEFTADVAAVVRAAEPVGVKLMLELPLLNARQREHAVQAAIDAGAAFVSIASSGLGRHRRSGNDRIPPQIRPAVHRREGVGRGEDRRTGPRAAHRRCRSDRNLGGHPHRHRRGAGRRIALLLLIPAPAGQLGHGNRRRH